MLTGYIDRFSYRGAEAVDVRISTDAAQVRVDLVRLIHGDANPAGPGFVTEPISTVVPQQITGRQQPVHPGSFMIATEVGAPDEQVSAIEILAWPTTPGAGRVQGLVSMLDADGNAALGIALDGDGRPVVVADGAVVARCPAPLHPRRWYRLRLSLDPSPTELSVTPLRPVPGEAATAVAAGDAHTVAGGRTVLVGALEQVGDLRGEPYCAGHYNGKLEAPRISGSDGDLANWAFEREQHTDVAPDTSGRERHGQLRQGPARAVTGHRFTGEHLDFRAAPDQYAAIHFHDDDLTDAGWAVDATVPLPADLTSGVYAIRLTRDGVHTGASGASGGQDPVVVDHIPFAVRSPAGAATAKVGYLLPTYTYVAYANERLQHRLDYQAAGITDHPITPGFHDRFLAEHPEFGLSLYDHHSDGSGVCYSSHLRPIPNLRPDYRMWLQNAPRHLSADLYVVAYLAHLGVDVEVVTDHDLHDEGHECLSKLQVLITGSHPEYYSGAMLDALQHHLDHGGCLMYLGGNGFYWVTSSAPDRPHVLEVRRSSGIRTWQAAPGEHHHSSTGEPGGLWRERGRSPHALVGVGMCSQGWDEKAPPFIRTPASYEPQYAWVFDGITDSTIGDFGLIMNGASGDELDRCDIALGSPPQTVVLATSARHSNYYQLAVEDVLMLAPGLGGADCADVRSDLVLVEQPSGGAVFSVGSICFTGCLPWQSFDNNAARLVRNVLQQFQQRGSKTC